MLISYGFNKFKYYLICYIYIAIPSVAKPPVQIIKPSPAMTSAQAMTTSDADSSSQSNFFKIVISLVVILNFLALNLPI